MDNQPTISYELRAASKLKSLETAHASLNLDDRITLAENPSKEIVKAINEDISALKPYGKTVLIDKLRPLTEVAIATKKSFGKFPDISLAQMAAMQGDLTTKADAFAVIENPVAHISLIDSVYAELNEQASLNNVVDLKAATHAVAALYGHVELHPSLIERSQKFAELVYDQSFIQATPHHLTNLAVHSNRNFLPAAIELTAQTKSAYHANTLLMNKNGCTKDAATSADDIDKLTSVVVDAGNAAELIALAENESSRLDVNNSVIHKLLAQAKVMHNDRRLAIYLSNIKKTMIPADIHSLHKALNGSFENMNSVASQTALLAHAKQASAKYPAEDYSIALMESSINDTKAHFEQLDENNKDKSLIDLSQPVIEFYSTSTGEIFESVALIGQNNEVEMNEALSAATKKILKACDDGELRVVFAPNTSELLKGVINTQIVQSISGQPNDLNRLLTQPVSKVAVRLDSRSKVQERIKFDAAIQNMDNSAVGSKIVSAANYNEFMNNPVFELDPKITIVNKKDSSDVTQYNFIDYDSFDDVISSIHSRYKDFGSDGYDVTLDIERAQPYLSSTLHSDLKDYMSDPSTSSMYRLNQHWQLKTAQFVDNREMDQHLAARIKTNIETKDVRSALSVSLTNTNAPTPPRRVNP